MGRTGGGVEGMRESGSSSWAGAIGIGKSVGRSPYE